MRASSFRYLVKSGVKNLWNNRMMTIASVGTLIACLLIVGFAVLFSINVDSIVEYMGQQNEIVVFMDLDTPDDYMTLMKGDHLHLPGRSLRGVQGQAGGQGRHPGRHGG